MAAGTADQSIAGHYIRRGGPAIAIYRVEKRAPDTWQHWPASFDNKLKCITFIGLLAESAILTVDIFFQGLPEAIHSIQ